MRRRMHVDELDIDEPLVVRLLESQAPDLANRDLAPVEPWGTDNAIWRLGEQLVVRLPRIGWASGQPDHEARWLPHLSPHVSVAIPEPVLLGQPGCGYPFAWSIHRWINGQGASPSTMANRERFAFDLAAFVGELAEVPINGAPPAKGRARPLSEYDDSTREYIDKSRSLIDAAAATAVWEEALAASPHTGPPVWVHSDLEGNCLLRAGRLCGVVDWAGACVGDPAVDVQVVWSPLFTEKSRRVFLDRLDVDSDTLARSRGAAVQQACGALPYYLETYPQIVERSWHKLSQLGISRR